MSRYRAAIIAVAGALLVALQSALFGDQRVTLEEAIQIAVAAWTAFQIWLTANVPSAPLAKAITAGALALLNGVLAALTGGIDQAEVVNLIIVTLVAAGVLALPNREA